MEGVDKVKAPAGKLLRPSVARAVAVLLAVVGVALAQAAEVPHDTNLVIRKAEVSSIVSFYPYYAGKIYMEIMAVRASDGTVRTALNTCQVCYGSGRGYYKQSGNEIICQNCGNRFRIDQIELTKGGCNPIPITKDLKTETADTITISRELLAQGAQYFRVWKRT